MSRFNIFIDESGAADIKSYTESPYFTLCGLVSGERSRDRLRNDIDQLKLRYFRRKSYVLHAADLHKHLKTATRVDNFAHDLDELLARNTFFLLYAVIDKHKAVKRAWTEKSTVYKRAYRSLLSNLIKFLVAKKAMGRICAEASSVEQDIFLYQSFFHYIAHGIDRLSISPKDVKSLVTEVSFVTKINNDAEEQLADLFGVCGRIQVEIKGGLKTIDSLTPITKVLYQRMHQKLFKPRRVKNPVKKRLYKEMNSFVVLP